MSIFAQESLDTEVSLKPGIILYRYVAREFFLPTCLTLGAFTVVVLTKDLTGYSELVINRGIGLARVGQIVLFQSLPLMTQVLPFAVLVGVLVGLGRLAADLEVTVMSALGIDSRRLLAPVALFGVAAALLGLLMSLVVAPWAERGLSRSLYEISEINPAAEIQPSVVHRFGDWKLEAKEVSNGGQSLKHVLLWMPVVGETVFSQKAEVFSGREGELEIILTNGTLLLNTRESLSAMRFDELRTALPRSQEIAELTLGDPFSEMTLAELAGVLGDPNGGGDRRKARSELHRRFVLPSAAALFGVLALPLALARTTTSRSSGAVIGLGVTVAYYGLVQFADGISQRAPDLTSFASWLPNVVLLVLAVILYSRMGKNSGEERNSVRFGVARGKGAALQASPNRIVRARRWALSRYVAGRFLQLALLCFAALAVAYLLVDILERLGWFGRHAATIEEIARFYSARIPLLFSRVVPMGLLVAMALTVSLLTSSGELVGMRSCGISAGRALRPALLVCLLVTPLSFLLNDQIVPRSNELADLIKQRDIKEMGSQRTAVWGTNGQALYQLESLDTSLGTADKIVVYQLLSNGLPESRIDARSARYSGDGQWLLRDATGVEMDQSGLLSSMIPPRSVELGEQPSDELDLMHISAGELWSLVRELGSSGHSTTAFEVDLHLKLATPLACLLLPALLMIFAVTGPPFPSSGLTLVLAGGLAVTYTLAAGSFASFGRGGAVPPWVGGWGPSLVVLVLLIGLVLRRRITSGGS